ncbi:MAG: DUF2807 domain-containing protein [Alphaproteobacteria bacterium]|nr:DUF2807 domain-containing protein [Alphaproteobacteria bacterium]
MTRTLLPLTAACAVATLAGCADTPADVRDVGAYSAAKVASPMNVEVTDDSTLDIGQVAVTCDVGDATLVSTTTVGGTVEVVADARLDATACTVWIHGGSLDHVEVTASDGDSTRIVVGAAAVVDIGTLTADRVVVDATADGVLHVGSLDADDAMLRATGDSSLTVDTTLVDQLGTDADGQAQVVIGAMDTTSWMATAHGQALIRADGVTELADLAAYGGATIDAMDVAADEATVSARGNATVEITALDLVSVDARGAASVSIGGDPDDANVSVSGGAEILGL